MFVLATLSDTFRILPQHLHKLSIVGVLEPLRDAIHAKYANRVIPERGLALFVHSILDYKDPALFAGDAGAYIKCVFRLVIFRPFPEEVIQAKVDKSTPEGIFASVGFFRNIFIPKENLPESCRFDQEKKVWLWTVDGNELDYAKKSEIRLKVVDVQFADFHADSQPGAAGAAAGAGPNNASATTTISIPVAGAAAAPVKVEAAASAASSAASSSTSSRAVSGASTGASSSTPAASTGANGTNGSASASTGAGAGTGAVAAAAGPSLQSQSQYSAPLRIIGTMRGVGLGVKSWWD